MSIDQKRVGDVSGDDTQLVDVHVVDVVDQSDASALCCVGWLEDPDVLL